METKSKLGVLVFLFLGIIVVLAMMPEIATNTQELTTKNTVVDESIDISPARFAGNASINETYPFTVTSAPTGWKVRSCPLTSVTYGNSSEDWTLNTDYRITLSSGVLYLNNTVNVNATDEGSPNETFIDYTYCQDGYITSTGGRGAASLILITAALGLLGYAVYLGVREWL